MLLSQNTRRLIFIFIYCFVTPISAAAGKKSIGKELEEKSGNVASSNIAAGTGNVLTPGVAAPTQDEFRASFSYYYPGQQVHHKYHGAGAGASASAPQWNRDSYSDAAAEFGYNPGQTQHTHVQPSYAVQSGHFGLTGHEDGFDFDDIGPLGGIGGAAAALLGLKGLKGLGILGLIKAGFLGLVPLFFLLLPALIIIPLLLLVLPIPVITVPSAGRAGAGASISPISGLNLSEWSGKMTTLARSVVESDKCIERISCEMSRIGRGSLVDRTIKRVLSRFETSMPGTLQRMARGYLEPTGCRRYGCFMIDEFQTKKPTTNHL